MQPILCAHLIRKVDDQLLDLLPSLQPAEWDLPTAAGTWQVRDVAAHLLDTALRKLSMGRDRCRVERIEIRSPQDLVDLINRLNREGVAVYRRLSPAVLCDLLQTACRQTADYYESLDPFANSAIGVSWAGEDTSANWFDTARELTERWHHQQQIRDAVGRPGIMTPELYHPVLDCFARGLPHAYREVTADLGATVRLVVRGPSGGAWQIRKTLAAWTLEPPGEASPTAAATVPEEIAWRVFTKGISRDDALQQATIEGDRRLVLPVLAMTSIVG